MSRINVEDILGYEFEEIVCSACFSKGEYEPAYRESEVITENRLDEASEKTLYFCDLCGQAL